MITKKDLDEAIETVIAQISKAIIKATENMATKDDLKRVENRLDGVENRLGKVETELIYVKNDVRDLKADSPTAKEFNNHEKRIKRLENKAFAS